MPKTPPAPAFDPADVPPADATDLARLMQLLIREGRGLMLLDGADPDALRAVEAAFWAESGDGSSATVAAIVRFRALTDAFAARRLRALLLAEGLPGLGAVFEVAASMRLNTARGLSPQVLLMRLAERKAWASQGRGNPSRAPAHHHEASTAA